MEDRFLDFRIENEPWYVSTRASQKDRFGKALALIQRYCGDLDLACDIGCADGQFSLKLASVARRVLAIDRHKGRIEGNKNRYKDLTNLRFVCLDILRDPIPSDPPDLVTALEILYYFSREEQELFMQRIVELLKPGGFFLMSVNVFRGSRFTEETVRGLLQRHFHLVAEKPIYRNVYYRFELKIIRLIDELNYLEKLRIFTPNILKLNRSFYPGKWNYLLLRPSWFMDRIAIPLVRQGALRLIRSRILYTAITGMTKLLLPRRGKSQILFLARKEATHAGD